MTEYIRPVKLIVSKQSTLWQQTYVAMSQTTIQSQKFPLKGIFFEFEYVNGVHTKHYIHQKQKTLKKEQNKQQHIKTITFW